MRFITEFELTKAEITHARIPVVEYRKQYSEATMGKLISESFDWQNPVHEDGNRFRLCIEAFPDAKWIEFKNKLADQILLSKLGYPIDDTKISELIKELESFGKPAGDAIINKRDE